MTLNKDENIENTKAEGEVKGEDEQYGKPNQQCQKHQKVISAETKTKEKEKENQEDITSTGKQDKNKNTKDEKERNRETKPQNITKPQNVTEESEKEICMGCNKFGERFAMWKLEVAIDGITTNVKEQLRRKSRNCTQRKHTTSVKRTKTESQ